MRAGPPGGQPPSGGARQSSAPPGVTARLASIGPDRLGARRAPRVSGPGTPRAGHHVALVSRGGRPPGRAWGAVHGGRHPGGGHGGRDPLCAPQRTDAMLGGSPVAIALGPAAPTGRTQTGHPHARRVLVEGPWASRSPAQVRRQGPLRRAHQPPRRQASRWTAPGRLCQRARCLVAPGPHAHVVPGASARELVGFVWAMAQAVPIPL
jgi:hypothetical protein